MQSNIKRITNDIRLFLIGIGLCMAWTAMSQVIPEFEYESTVCLNQSVVLTNTSTDAVNYSWDFCSGDLEDTNLNVVQKTFNGLSVPVGVSLFNYDGNWYGFITNVTNNSITKLSFGSSLANPDPQIVNLGNLGGMLAGPQDVKAIQQNGQIYLFVSNRTGNKLIRINLGSDINNSSPTTDVLLSGNGDINNNGVEVVFDGQDWIVFYTSQQLIRILRLGSTLSGLPTASDIMSTSNITGANGIGDISIVRQNGKWYGFIVGYTSRTLHRLTFGTSLFSDPAQQNITVAALSSHILQSIVIRNEGAKYFAFVSTSAGDLLRMDFGDNVENSYTVNGLGKYGLFANTFKIDIANDGSFWKALTPNWTANRIYLVDFPNNCGSAQQTSIEESPVVTFNQSGTFRITLKAFDADGENNAVSHTTTVSTTQAPIIDLTFSDEVCVDSEISMASEADQPLDTYNWNFGDGDTSSDESPGHAYSSPGEYKVSLSVEGNNGCKNYTEETVTIFSVPQSDFSIPSDNPLCTNQLYVFENTSQFDAGSPVIWTWSVDDVPQSQDQNFNYAFTQAVDYDVTLLTSIPGCSNSITKTINSLAQGPDANFTFEGQCESSPVSFSNTTTGDVLSYEWDFDNGATSFDVNPEYTFDAGGKYFVKLTAISPNGCNNNRIKEVTIYTKPAVDFVINPPPYACSGSSAPFINLTSDPIDGTITSWLWQFGDSGDDNESTLKDPSHTFLNAGIYNVKLTATTGEGCSATSEKPVEIFQSPSTTIERGPTCVGVPSRFTALGNDIVYYYWEIGTLYYEQKDAEHTFNAPGNYPLRLIVQGSNNCETVVTQNISVPVPLIPDFSVTRNCVGHEAVFTDLTSGADPVARRDWEFASVGNATGSPASYMFEESGDHAVKLTVTGESGCNYSSTKVINVIMPPVADFSVFPEEGGAPHEVQFTNASTGATQYSWSFGNGENSQEVSPVFTYNEAGNFTTVLTAANDIGCESTFSRSVNVLSPLPDVDIQNILTVENADGTISIIVTLHNKGNTYLKDLALDLDLSGKIILREIVDAHIAPSSLYNVTLDYRITQPAALTFLCANAILPNDLAPEGNRICTELKDQVVLFTPFPNPVHDELILEWISPNDQPAEFLLVDSFGKTVLKTQATSRAGLNQTSYDVTGLGSGVYTLIFKSGSVTLTQRILILQD